MEERKRNRKTHLEQRGDNKKKQPRASMTPAQQLLLGVLAGRVNAWHSIQDLSMHGLELPNKAIGISLKGLWVRGLVDMTSEKERTVGNRHAVVRRYSITGEGLKTLLQLKDGENNERRETK